MAECQRNETVMSPICKEFAVPTYAYVCTECAHSFDIVQAITDDALTECPSCGGQLRKKFHPVGVAFKGSGFYRTDSRAGSSSTDSKSSDGSSTSDATPSPSKGADSGSSSKKEGSTSGASGSSSSSSSSTSSSSSATSSS